MADHVHIAPTRTPDRRSRASYETGESSATGSSRNVTPPTTLLDTSPEDHHDGALAAQSGRSRRRHKNRLSSAFLLHDAVGGDQEKGLRRVSRNILQRKGKRAAHKTPDRLAPDAGQDSGFQSDGSSRSTSRRHKLSPETSPKESEKAANGTSPEKARDPAAEPEPAVLDVDSSQIVNMALNLSEARRVQTRRATIAPPRLAPLADAAAGSNLKQHLQQQRKVSRTGSPKPIQSARIPSGLKANSPFQTGFDTNFDGRRQIQFSSSTLARAQKAKEHLELMAQYRELLDHLPPLKPGHDRSSNMSPPLSPVNSRTVRFGAQESNSPLGRPYNPLQYIRNRKVRARERKVIDGEQQGFGDVEMVRAWVTITITRSHEEDFTIPDFPGADEQSEQVSSDSAGKVALRTRRPRVDWSFDPSDMIADSYWLEQRNHKQLIEDRSWRRIFPSSLEPRPNSRQVDDPVTGNAPQSPALGDLNGAGLERQDSKLQSAETDSIHAGTRERAKQRLQDMKGFSHRHTTSLHGPDFLRHRRDSLSETSGSDSELKIDGKKRSRPGRRDTITSDTNDLLQKQMLEIVAQEQKERELEKVPETEVEHQVPEDPASNKTSEATRPVDAMHNRKASLTETSESDSKTAPKKPRWESPARQPKGRASLEVPERPWRLRRGSDSSVQSTASRVSKDGIPMSLALDLSPSSSRAGSPARNRMSRVKQRLWDRGRREHSVEAQAYDTEDERMSIKATPSDPPSPADKIIHRSTDESWKTHRSTGSMKMRQDEQSVGLRGIFKGPRIDSVLRGGVSKLSDIIWKKDAIESSTDDSSSDESGSDDMKLKLRLSPTLSRQTSSRIEEQSQPQTKRFFDNLPTFQPISETQHRPSDSENLQVSPPSRPASRQSTRWEQLKPPRIDISNASTPPPMLTFPQESDVSDSESNRQSVADGAREADGSADSPINGNLLDKPRSSSRHWSITDSGTLPHPHRARLTKREVARMRALILSSGIKAKEITRRSQELQKPLLKHNVQLTKQNYRQPGYTMPWTDISKICADCPEMHDQEVQTCEMYPFASRALGMAIQASGQRWQASADTFTNKTATELQSRIWHVRSRLTDELSSMTRQAADDADETSRDLALGQPLKVKHIVDVMDKLLRQRRRRFRWLRRGMWLVVEWTLVGFMWYIWLMVMILRVAWGVGSGFVQSVRWLMWL